MNHLEKKRKPVQRPLRKGGHRKRAFPVREKPDANDSDEEGLPARMDVG